MNTNNDIIWIDGKPDKLIPGMLLIIDDTFEMLRFASEETNRCYNIPIDKKKDIILVGDVNVLNGICDDCRLEQNIIGYSISLINNLSKIKDEKIKEMKV